MGAELSRSCPDLPCLRGSGHTQKFRASEKKNNPQYLGRGGGGRAATTSELRNPRVTQALTHEANRAGNGGERVGQPWEGILGARQPLCPWAQGDSDHRSS